MVPRLTLLAAAALAITAGLDPARAQTPAGAPITVAVDMREASRKILHAHLVIPASPGTLALAFPEWIPGEHGPTGPITNLSGMRFRAGNATLPWRRDSADMYKLTIEVPPGARSIEVDLDFLLATEEGLFTAGGSATAALAALNWNQVLLYPAGRSSDELVYAASVTLPAGWKYGTALVARASRGGRIEFAPVSLTTLVDSPLLAGAHFRTFDLARDPPVVMYAAADSDAALAMPPATEQAYRRLVPEALALFGAYHFNAYAFLFTLSDHVEEFGLEHHQSSDDRAVERSLIDEDARRMAATLLPHEMVHSWNGKYRRPADLAAGHFDEPMHGDLLWVYEGLTTYLGNMLAPRAGLVTIEEHRDRLAYEAAMLDNRGGRTWRPLADTAIAAQLLYEASHGWRSARRGVDFYAEGELIWLEVDTIIRAQSHGARSIDDFCKRFFGGKSGPPAVVPYTYDDVVAALDDVAPYDWRAFFTARVQKTSPRAPTGGLEAAGWRLGYGEERSPWLKSEETVYKYIEESFSVGLVVKEKGTIQDVIPGSPADKAGIGPGMKIVAVDGRKFTPDLLRQAIHDSKTTRSVELLVEHDDFFTTYRLAYAGGARYPRLERDGRKPDLLSAIAAPHAAAGAPRTP